MNHVEYLKSLGACDDSLLYASEHPDLRSAWDNCQRGDWLLWLLDHIDYTDASKLRRIAVECVRRTPIGEGRVVADLLIDPRSLAALEVASRYAMGDATEGELAAVWDAACDDARAAARDAARAAVRDDALDDARDDARAAAWAAARDDARAAARDAVRAAAWAASGDAARAAALDAALAALAAQAQIVREIIVFDELPQIITITIKEHKNG